MKKKFDIFHYAEIYNSHIEIDYEGIQEMDTIILYFVEPATHRFRYIDMMP